MDTESELYRGTGRTTNRILHWVRVALDNPGKVVAPKDHWDRVGSHRYVTHQVHSVLTLLNVEHDYTIDNIKVLPRKH